MRFILLILLMASVLTGIAQTPGTPVAMADPGFNAYFYKSKAPVVSGKIINVSSEELKNLAITYSQVVPFEGLQQKGICKINMDGSFSFQLDYPFPYQQIWINLGDYFYSGIYVNKGIYLELDFAQLKQKNVFLLGPGAKYLGADGPVTQYLNQFVLFRRDEQLEASSAFNRLEVNARDYASKLDSINAVKENIEIDFIKQNPSPYSWILRNERLSGYYSALIRQGFYNNSKPLKWEEINLHKPALVSNESGDFFQALYSYLLSKVKGNPLAIAGLKDIPNIDPVILKAADKDVKANAILLDSLMRVVKTPWVKTVLKKQYEENVKRLDEINANLKAGLKLDAADTMIGQPVAAYPFGGMLYDAGKVTAADFLAKLASKFKGKAMVVDIWATWCMPCLAGMPSSAKLHHEAADLPIEFVYLCTTSGSNKDKWKNKVVELKQPGTHILISDQLTNELMGMFKKGGFPSYICFDQSGQVSGDLSISSITAVSLDDLRKLILR